MLIVESGPFGRRFRLLETMRQFAAEQLASRRDRRDRRAPRAVVPPQVTDIHRLLVGRAEIEGVARLDELWPNLRAGSTGRAPPATELAAALVRPVAPRSTCASRARSVTGPSASSPSRRRPTKDDIVFWLACAAYRYMRNRDLDGYERLVHRYGEPDHPMIRYTRAYLYDDAEALWVRAVEAVAWLRSEGEEEAAAHVEIAGVASGLMISGRFDELDPFITALIGRYRSKGPPTLLYVTLAMLGYSALLQGRADEADRIFDEAASIEVPARTSSVNEPGKARAAFRNGNRSRAFRILRSHVQQLLETDYTDLARLAAVEFINMMTAIDRLPDAARMLGYLASTGDFGALAVRALVADAASKVAASAARGPGRFGTTQPDLDSRKALEYMRDTLGELANHEYTHRPSTTPPRSSRGPI